MIGLYLLSAHMVGDFVFSTRWQADAKLDHLDARVRHVVGYAIPFVPIAFIYARMPHLDRWSSGAIFLGWLLLLHLVTDSRRFHSTLGDVIGYRLRYPTHEDRLRYWNDETNPDRIASLGIPNAAATEWPRPNPWPPMSLLIDQTLHLVQLAVLGGLFLS